MWQITEAEEGWNFLAIAMRVITDSLGHEHILLQRVGDNVPKLPLEVSGTEWDELVALVEADRTRRAAEVERENSTRSRGEAEPAADDKGNAIRLDTANYQRRPCRHGLE